MESGPPPANKVPFTAADFMRRVSRQALRLPDVSARLQELWSEVLELPASWPPDLAK